MRGESSNLSDFKELYCSEHWKDTCLAIFYKAVVLLYIFLTITAISGNILILVAFTKDSSLHPPSKLLLRSLTITDLCVGAISQPLAILFMLSTVNKNWDVCRVTEYTMAVATTVFGGASLSIVTAIGADRLLALLLRVRYRQVVTMKRVRTAVFVFWFRSNGVKFLCSPASSDFGDVLYSFRCGDSCNCSSWIKCISLYRRALNGFFSSPEFFTKPGSLLLEDQRSHAASSKRKTGTCLFLAELKTLLFVGNLYVVRRLS